MGGMSVAMTEPQEITTSDCASLAELTNTANHEHALVVEAGMAMVEHAIRCGETLVTVRSICRDADTWNAWLTDEFASSRTNAYRYIRIAQHRDLPAVREASNIREAELSLKGLPYRNSHLAGAVPDEAKAWMRDLRDEGLTYSQISEIVGYSEKAVGVIVNPKRRAWKLADERRRYRRQAAARAALKAQERDRQIRRAVRKAGAATQEAYAMAERFQDVLAQARDETSGEAREALERAGEHYRKMRDEIVRALGVTA